MLVLMDGILVLMEGVMAYATHSCERCWSMDRTGKI